MPFGAFLDALPPAVFVVYHAAVLVAASYFALRAFAAERGSLGWAFTLFALAELLYASAHLDVTVLLFASTTAELLDLAAMVLVFGAAVRRTG